MLVYIAGPLSNGGGKCLLSNVVKAVEVAEQLYERGHWSFVPHLTAFQERILQHTHNGHNCTHNRWLIGDAIILSRCDALYFIAPSPGANIELGVAQAIGIPVFRNMDDVPIDTEELEKRNTENALGGENG